jgi:Flp pilus assembly protein TadG
MTRAGNVLHKLFGILRQSHGAQLFEFALTLPIMLVVMIGIFDFGGAWNTKQKLANAVREGTRIGAAAPKNDLSQSTCASPPASSPCSVQSIADAVKEYMVNAGLSDASCLTQNAPSSQTGLAWTYTCGNGTSLTINRGATFTATGGGPVEATKVTLTYPYTWTLNRVIGLLPGGGSISLPATITTDGMMQNF